MSWKKIANKKRRNSMISRKSSKSLSYSRLKFLKKNRIKSQHKLLLKSRLRRTELPWKLLRNSQLSKKLIGRSNLKLKKLPRLRR